MELIGSFTKAIEEIKERGRIIIVAYNLKHSRSSIMAWAHSAASRAGSLIFIDAVTHDDGSRTNSDVYRNIVSASLQRNALNRIRRNFSMQ